MYVEVAETKLRKEPKMWASSVRDLHFGDALIVEATEGDWLKVSIENDHGFVHRTALSVKKLSLSNAVAPGNAGSSKTDVVLAGKGLSSDLEKDFESSHPEADFTTLNSIEREPQPDESTLQAFLKVGKLKGTQ